MGGALEGPIVQAETRPVVRVLGHAHGSQEAGCRGGLDVDPLGLVQLRQQGVEVIVIDGDEAVDEMLHGPTDEARGASAGEPIRSSDVIDAEVLHAHGAVETRVDAQEHRRAVRRLGEDHPGRIAELDLETEGDPARAAADPAGQVDEKGVPLVDCDIEGLELPGEPVGGHGVAEEQVAGILIVDEEAGRVVLRLCAPPPDGLGVVRRVLDHLDAVGSQHVLLPLPRIGGHVDDGPETQFGAHHADRQPEIPGGAHGDRVSREEVCGLRPGQDRVVVVIADQARRDGEVLGMLEHLVDPAPGLDRSGDRQLGVELEPEATGNGMAAVALHIGLHRGDCDQRRLQDAQGCTRIGEDGGQIRREALQTRRGVLDVGPSEPDVGEALGGAADVGIEPAGLGHRGQRLQQRQGPGPFLCGAAVDAFR